MSKQRNQKIAAEHRESARLMLERGDEILAKMYIKMAERLEKLDN